MKTIALVGDPSPDVRAHRAIPLALEKWESRHPGRLALSWFPTADLGRDGIAALGACAAVWCVPGSPYARMDAALAAIRFARESGRPFLGTCGGCQHAVIEYARHVAGLADADHEETNPQGANLVITRLACSLADGREELALRPGSRLHAALGAKSTERYRCNFGPGHRHAELYRDGALHVTAVNADGEPRAFELPGHPWFVATLFQPELHALEGRLHPIIAAFFAHVAGGAENA